MPLAPEALGPAERILQTVLQFHDHAVHNRPGVVTTDPSTPIGVRWEFCTHKVEKNAQTGADEKVVYFLRKQGKKNLRVRAGVMGETKKNGSADVTEGGRKIGEYRRPGLFPEVVAYLYRQVAEVWKLDNEFAARWASYQFGEEHRDLKVILAAFMLVQSRRGEPVMEGGKAVFFDDDFRAVGEAMMLVRKKDGKDLNPKLLLRIRDVLRLPEVVEVNRRLGFGRSAKHAPLGRWDKAVEKWLRHREENPTMLAGLMKSGFRTTVMELAQTVRYRPETPYFFDVLRWKQNQSKDGRREISIGKEVRAAETWWGFSEAQICMLIEKEKPNYKRIVSLVPKEIGLTPAIVCAAVEFGAMSDKDLVAATPTLEDLNLLEVQTVRERWEKATRAATDMRAANVAKRVKSETAKAGLEKAADEALKKATEEAMKAMRCYVFIDRSGSMVTAIEAAKNLLPRFLPAFPADKLHIAYFNTVGTEVKLKAHTAAGVEQAFKGVMATGGTDHGSGVRALAHHKPQDDEDVIFIFIGDQQEDRTFDAVVKWAGLRPMAFGFVHTRGTDGEHRKAVEQTAANLQIPCFRIDEKTFADTYAAPRTIRALVAATPVGIRNVPMQAAPKRVSLVETIMKTELLMRPAWA